MTVYAAYAPDAGGRAPVPVSVRPATDADVEVILRIEEAAGRARESIGSAEGYHRAVADPERCVLVAESVDGSRPGVPGWAKTHRHLEAVDLAPAGHYLGGITVDPAWRRRGVGAALTDARLRWLAARTDEVYFVVNAQNRASIDLHARWGFTEVLRAPRLMGLEFTGGVGLLMRAGVAGMA
jgi:ribosomal protein S18 acetylase RimI-like enzyme